MDSKALVAAALFLASCASAPDPIDEPARIVEPDENSRAALRATLHEALGVSVTVSDAALTDSSLLVIENQPPATMENPVPQGRIMDLPIQFRLVRNGDDCILINRQDEKRYLLRDTRCVPE